jgi:hypothetical protein
MKIDQRILEEGKTVGDCFKSCVATVLGLNYEDVPHFVAESADAYNWF